LPASVVTRQVLDADSDLTDAVLVVTAGADGSAGELPAINELALRRNLTWLPIGAFDGAVIRVGPLMIPGATACFRCTVTRLAANVEFPAEFVELAVRMPAADAPPAVDQWAIGFATLLLLRWLGAADAGAAGVLHTLVPAELTTRAARVYPVPRCCACHAADWLPAAAPWEVGDDGR
jgi:bacteriocin biosynthesis cyclodehydratase domain-containing protein